MSYTEILLRVPQEQVDPLTDALLEAGALSVLVEDADRDSPDEQALFGEPGMEPILPAWVHSELVVLLSTESSAQAILDEAFATIQQIPIQPHAERSVAEQDWVRLTQSQFAPIPISQRLWIVPTWHEQPVGEDALVLRLDPGLAFGTGSHPTTRLCLQWLEAHLPNMQGPTLLDYGCGSGILAIAARKLGAGATIGIDIDAQAIRAAEENAALNAVAVKFGLPDTPILDQQRFQIVIANILSNPLKILAPMLSQLVKPSGYLVLSGVLERQAAEVAAAYAPYITLQVWQAAEGWVCLAGRKID